MGRKEFSMRRSYSPEFKQAAVQKLSMPGGPSIMELSKKIGIHHTSLRKWRDLYGITNSMKKSKEWTAERKLQAIIETSSFSEGELGEYLRKHGLHSHELQEWKEQCLGSFKSPGRPQNDPEVKVLQASKKALEKDLTRKNKALAEMSARIVLLKKSRLLWGEDEEDE